MTIGMSINDNSRNIFKKSLNTHHSIVGISLSSKLE